MAQYTVKDNSTKKTITFDWDGDGPPTDADMVEVFAAAKQERSAQLGKGAKMDSAEASDYAANRAAFAQEGGVNTFGGAKGGDTRKVSYTDSGYRPNKPERTLKGIARNAVQDVVELPLMPVRIAQEVANSPDTPKTLAELGKNVLRGPLEFIPGVGEALGGRSATEAWQTNPGFGAMTLAGVGAAGKAARGKAPIRSLKDATRPAQTELQTLSREHGVPLTAGEELSSPNLKQVEARLERLPVLGIRGFRKKQGEALADSATRLADEFATAAEDPATSLVDRFKSNLKKAKEESSEAYGKIDEALAANGDAGAIEPVATRGQLKTLLAKSPDIFERLPGSQNRLKSIMAEIVGDTAPKKVGIEVAPEFGTVRKHGEAPKVLLGPDGKPITKQTTPKLSYEDYTWLRSQLGEYIDRAHSSAGAVGSNELRQLTMIKKALDTDFYRWGKNSGYENVTAAVDNARNVYKTKVAPFENVPVLKSIINDRFTPEQLLDAIAKPGQATLATRAMKGLKDGDKALVQDAIMRRALAFGFEGAKDGAPMSAAKFASFIEKMDTRTKNAARSPMDVFFSPAEKQRVIGFAKLARAAERSSQYSANPLTGVAAADLAIPGAIGTVAGTVGAPAAISAAAVTKAMSLMLTTPQGKALLHRAYRTPAGAKAAWASILNQATKINGSQQKP